MNAWRCSICGYVHRGDDPPEMCPVCGAPREAFEPYVEQAEPRDTVPPKKWRCGVCGYEHAGDKPPSDCPLCGAPRDNFLPVTGEPTAASAGDLGLSIVIVGGGIAGVSAAESARKTSPKAAITLISQEGGVPYYRINLTRLLAGEVDEASLQIHPSGWYSEHGVELVDAEAIALWPADRAVELRGGQRIPFDRLILACGAHPFTPPFMAETIEGLMTLRTLADARTLIGLVKPGIRVLCIGGGILGLETAAGLARRGAGVTVLESHSYLMPRQLSRRAGDILGTHLEGLGVRLLKHASTKEILGSGHVGGVLLESGSRVEADLIVVTTGVRSNTHLARSIGLEVNQGIVVDNHLATSNPAILAAGDAAEHKGLLYGSWYAAQYQGSIAGMNAAGVSSEFGGIPRSHTLKVLGIDMTSVGQFEPIDGSYRIVEDESGTNYRRFVFRDSRIVGGILLGDTRSASALTKAIEKKADFPDLLAGVVTAQSVADSLGQ
ncbi:MAG: FAD-dependent oxidoreductase [Verrucomicrobiota bacterium]